MDGSSADCIEDNKAQGGTKIAPEFAKRDVTALRLHSSETHFTVVSNGTVESKRVQAGD